MAYLEEKIKLLKKALKSWEEVLNEPYSDIVRDAAIQRYEFSFELLWKTIKLHLSENEGITCNSPKSCFRELGRNIKLNEKEIETCLQMTNDRNLSVHTYSEKMAKILYKRTFKYLEISKKIFEQII